MYYEAKRYSEAEKKYKTAEEILMKLTRLTPAAIEPDLAKCYCNMGELYKETKRFAEAIDALNYAIRLNEKCVKTNPAFTDKIITAQKMLDSINDSQRQHESAISHFTPDERVIALLLTEGLSQREISKKLNITATEVVLRVNAIREKVSGEIESNPVIDAVTRVYELTRREADVLSYLQRKAGNELIASELFLTEDTIRFHIRNLLKKLSIEKRAEIGKWLETYAENNM